MMLFSRVSLLFTATLSAIVIASCGGGADPVPSPSPSPVPTPTPIDVSDLLRRSGTATSALTSFSFRLEHNRGGGTPLTETLVVTEADGRVISPDRISTDFAGTLGTFAVRSSLITVGEASYMTNPLTGDWEEVPKEVSPLGFFDPQRGIGSLISGVQSPVLISKSDSEFRIDGVLEVAELRPILGDAAQGTTVQVRLTIDTATMYLKQAIIEGRATATEPDGVVRTITLSRFNEQFTIEPPGRE